MAKGGGEACQACRQRGVRENLGGVPGSGLWAADAPPPPTPPHPTPFSQHTHPILAICATILRIWSPIVAYE